MSFDKAPRFSGSRFAGLSFANTANVEPANERPGGIQLTLDLRGRFPPSRYYT